MGVEWIFNIKEKLKEIYEALRKKAWWLMVIGGVYKFIIWLIEVWFPARANTTMDWLLQYIDTTTLDLASANVAWARINQWVPVSEMMTMFVSYCTLAGMVAFTKWVKKLLPFA